MRTVAAFFNEIASALQFPPYFGENWAAFEDCMRDLDWLPASAYVLVLWDAEELLADEPADVWDYAIDVLRRDADACASARNAGLSRRPEHGDHPCAGGTPCARRISPARARSRDNVMA